MNSIASKAPIHIAHAKWGIDFGQSRGFGVESPEQVDHRFYEFRRDALQQGDDYSVYRVAIDALKPAEFIKQVSPRRESYRKEFLGIADALAKDNGFFKIPMNTKEATIELRGVTDLHPYQLIFRTGIDPIIEAFLIHIAFALVEGCRIRRCGNCDFIFVRDGRRPQLDEEAFCGVSCARSAAVKRFREKQKTEAKPKSRRKK